MPTEYRVLDLPVETSDEAVIDRLLDALARLGGPDADFVEEEHQTTPTQVMTRFGNESGDAAVTVWRDNVAQIRYLEMTFPTEKRLAAAIAAVQRHFDIVRHQDVLDRISAAAPDATLADNVFYELAYSAPGQPAGGTARVLCENLASRSASRRSGAATAAGILGWREFEDPLRSALAGEQDSAVRDAMERALRALA